MEQIVGRDGRGPGAVVMKTYEIYSIWADAITAPPPPTDHPPPLVGPLHTAHLCEQVLVTRICVYIYVYTYRSGDRDGGEDRTLLFQNPAVEISMDNVARRLPRRQSWNGTMEGRGRIGGFLGGIRWIGMADPRFVTTISTDGDET